MTLIETASGVDFWFGATAALAFRRTVRSALGDKLRDALSGADSGGSSGGAGGSENGAGRTKAGRIDALVGEVRKHTGEDQQPTLGMVSAVAAGSGEVEYSVETVAEAAHVLGCDDAPEGFGGSNG